MSDALLTYAISTDPDPLQASPPKGDPSLATLTIIVSNPTRNTIDCSKIDFGFLKGTNANEFFSDATGIVTTAPKGWTITQNDAVFIATPDTSGDGEVGTDGLAFGLSNIKVNDQSGTTVVTITEDASQTGGPIAAPVATRKASIALSKFPPRFEVGDFTAHPLVVTHGAGTTLSWNGTSGATYELQYVDADGNVVTIDHPKDEPNQPLPSTGSYTVDNLRENPTIFDLIVTLAVPGQDNSLEIQRELAVAVEITPVRIENLQALPSVVYGADNQVPVTLSWETVGAQQVLINGDLVEGQSKTFTINETTNFTLEATGKDGPVYKEITVNVEEVNPKFWYSKIGINTYKAGFSFGANPGHYSAIIQLFWSGQFIMERDSGLTVDGDSQVVQVDIVASPNEELVLTVSGYPSGQITSKGDIPGD